MVGGNSHSIGLSERREVHALTVFGKTASCKRAENGDYDKKAEDGAAHDKGANVKVRGCALLRSPA